MASTRLENGQSLHPKIHITVPQSYLSELSAAECSPAVLVRLPPALFIDPNTFPAKAPASSSAKVVSLRHLGSDHPSLSSYDFTRVELEGGVGYSDPERTERAKSSVQNTSGREVKRVSGDKYVAASKGSLHARYQDAHADAQQPLAKEHRAALLKLQKVEPSSVRKSKSVDRLFDSLTGQAIGQEEEEEGDNMTSIEIPLHARYVEPVNGETKRGNYEQVSLDKPDVFWMCEAVEFLPDPTIYDKIDASELLPSPHSHLSLQLPLKHNFYRLKMDDQDRPLSIALPAGNISFAPAVHLATFASLILAAFWAVVQVQAILNKLNKAQSGLQKRALGKAD